MSYRMDRRAYAETYGPTTGDRVRFVGQLLSSIGSNFPKSPIFIKNAISRLSACELSPRHGVTCIGYGILSRE